MSVQAGFRGYSRADIEPTVKEVYKTSYQYFENELDIPKDAESIPVYQAYHKGLFQTNSWIKDLNVTFMHEETFESTNAKIK